MRGSFSRWLPPSRSPRARAGRRSLRTFPRSPTVSTSSKRWSGRPIRRFEPATRGTNSLKADSETATSITSTLYGGLRLWKGAAVYFNPELSGGTGLSSAVGVAGFVNGETFRIGSVAPVLYPARLFLRQTFNLGDDEVLVPTGANSSAAPRARNGSPSRSASSASPICSTPIATRTIRAPSS